MTALFGRNVLKTFSFGKMISRRHLYIREVTKGRYPVLGIGEKMAN